jgi:hypothetical protein
LDRRLSHIKDFATYQKIWVSGTTSGGYFDAPANMAALCIVQLYWDAGTILIYLILLYFWKIKLKKIDDVEEKNKM